MSLKPFKANEQLATSSVEALRDWLDESVDSDIQLTIEYTVGDLIKTLDNILNGMWNDGIDAMGEDA